MRKSHRKGITIEEEYGTERAKEIRRKNSEGHMGQTPWNKDIPRTEAEKQKISKNRKGKCCGSDNPNYGKHPIPWNKNKPWSDKVKNKISKTLTGKLVGENNPNYGNRGSKNPLYGTKRLPETIEKMRQIKLGENNPFYGHKHSDNQRAKWSEDRKGSKHPQWIDGRSYEPYTSDWTDTLKEAIRQRDGYKCQKCGCPQAENVEKLSVHHADYNKKNCNPTNLITLCRGCHSEVNFDRDHWQSFFEDEHSLIFSKNTIGED